MKCSGKFDDAEEAGAIYLAGLNTLKVTNSAFTNNRAKALGGAINVRYSHGRRCKTTLINTVFRGNKAGMNGGAVAIRKVGRTEIFGCEFYENTVNVVGGAVSIVNTFEKENMSLISECIFTNNRATIGGESDDYMER